MDLKPIKKIKFEFPIHLKDGELSLFRFPNKTHGEIQIKEVLFKPHSKFTVIKTEYPVKNTSALKMKSLNTSLMTYKALPTQVDSYYFAKFEESGLILQKIKFSYIFYPVFDFYKFDYKSVAIKKAENREEYEHRMRNINYKLKNIEGEDFRKLFYETRASYPTFISDDIKNARFTELTPFPSQEKLLDQLNNLTLKVEPKKIKQTILNSRICNLKDLVLIYPNKDLVLNTLLGMTDVVSGRCILKNSYYERSLHPIRSRILDLFRTNTTLKPRDIDFASGEEWVVTELCDFKDGIYTLKGFYEEELSLNTFTIHNIINILEKERVMSAKKISLILNVDVDLVVSTLSSNEKSGLFVHLANNCYAIDDEDDWFNKFFHLAKNKKVFELKEIEDIIDRSKREIVEELKKYCIHKGNKYYLMDNFDTLQADT